MRRVRLPVGRRGWALALTCVAAAAVFHGRSLGAGRANHTRDWSAPIEAGAGGWTRVNPIPATGQVLGFWGRTNDDVWAWSLFYTFHWDGRVWSVSERPPEGGQVSAVGGVPGGIWVELDVHFPERSSGCEVFEAHDEAHFWIRTGAGWSRRGPLKVLPDEATTPNQGLLEPEQLALLWSRYAGARTVPDGVVMATAYRVGGGDVWAADEKGRWMSRLAGGRWISAANPTWAAAQSIWFASQTDGWAVSTHDRSHWDGTRWATVHEGFTGTSALSGAAADDVWLVGHGVPAHWDGSRWNEVPLPKPESLSAISARSANDVWALPACGSGGGVFHWDGAAWRRHVIPDLTVTWWPQGLACPLVAAQGNGEVVVMTGQRVLSRRRGIWVETPGPLAGRIHPPKTGGMIVAISTDGAGTTWAVGKEWAGAESHPLAFRRSSGVWLETPLPAATTEIKAVWARGPSDAWLVGTTKGLILHWDGRAWSREESGTDDKLLAVHGAGGLVWAVGEMGTFLRRRL